MIDLKKTQTWIILNVQNFRYPILNTCFISFFYFKLFGKRTCSYICRLIHLYTYLNVFRCTSLLCNSRPQCVTCVFLNRPIIVVFKLWWVTLPVDVEEISMALVFWSYSHEVIIPVKKYKVISLHLIRSDYVWKQFSQLMSLEHNKVSNLNIRYWVFSWFVPWPINT